MKVQREGMRFIILITTVALAAGILLLGLGVAEASSSGESAADAGPALAWRITATCNPDGTISGTTTIPGRASPTTFTVFVEDHHPGEGFWVTIPGSSQTVTAPPNATSVAFGPLDVSQHRPGIKRFLIQLLTWIL